MSIGRILGGLLLLVLLALVGIVLYLQYADLNRHRPLLEAQVSDLLGREFKIGGPIELDLLPAPALELGQLSLANADWGSEPEMARVGHAAARVNLASLISGPIQIEALELHDVDVLLETNAAGASNLDFGEPQAGAEAPPGPAEPEDSKAGGLPLMLHYVDLGNITLVQRAPEQDDQVIHLDALTLKPNDRGWLAISGGGKILDHDLVLSGEIGPEDSMADLAETQFNLAGELGPLQLQTEGVISDLEALQGARATVLLRAEDVSELLALADLDLPLEGPLELKSDIAQTQNGADISLEGGVEKIHAQGQFGLAADSLDIDLAVTPLDAIGKLFEVEDLPHEALDVKGRILFGSDSIGLEDIVALLGTARLEAQGNLATGDGESKLALKASGRSMASLLTTLPEIPFEAALELALTPTLLTVEPLTAQLGDSDLQGKVVVDTGEETTVIDATLNSKLLDLRPFQQSDEPAADEAEADTEAATEPTKEAPPEKAPKKEYVFVDEPLPFETLQQTDADFDLKVNKLITQGIELDQLKVVGGLHGGDLAAAASFTTPDGGKSSSDIKLTTSGKQARLKVDIGARDMHINVASGDVDNVDDIPEIGITIELQSAGDTPRKLASSANGRVIITQGSGRIENALLGRVSGDILAQLFSALNPLSKEEKYSNWECSVIAINVVDGLAKIDALVLQGEKIQIIAGGKIDLNTEKLDIEFNTKPRSGVGISADMFVTPFVALKGTLASPSVGLNETGALLTTGAAFLTGGLSLIAQGAADRATAEIDHCKKTLPEYPHPPLKTVE